MSAQRWHVRRERWSVVDPGRIAAYAVIWVLLALLAIALVLDL